MGKRHRHHAHGWYQLKRTSAAVRLQCAGSRPWRTRLGSGGLPPSMPAHSCSPPPSRCRPHQPLQPCRTVAAPGAATDGGAAAVGGWCSGSELVQRQCSSSSSNEPHTSCCRRTPYFTSIINAANKTKRESISTNAHPPLPPSHICALPHKCTVVPRVRLGGRGRHLAVCGQLRPAAAGCSINGCCQPAEAVLMLLLLV